MSIRHIVSDNNSPTQKLENYLAKIICKTKKKREQYKYLIILPFLNKKTNKIGRILIKKSNYGTSFKPQRTVLQLLGIPKDVIPLVIQGVYGVSRENCEKNTLAPQTGEYRQDCENYVFAILSIFSDKQLKSAFFQNENEIH